MACHLPVLPLAASTEGWRPERGAVLPGLAAERVAGRVPAGPELVAAELGPKAAVLRAVAIAGPQQPGQGPAQAAQTAESVQGWQQVRLPTVPPAVLPGLAGLPTVRHLERREHQRGHPLAR